MIINRMFKRNVICRRQNQYLYMVGYISVLGGCLILIFNSSNREEEHYKEVQPMEDVEQFSYFKPRPKYATLEKLMDIPFVPRDHKCDEMFEKSKHPFQYPDVYGDNADAYKAELNIHKLLQEGVATEHSWVIMSLGALPFVRTVCETHFTSGHNTFHWLVSQDDVTVHSFAPDWRNYTSDLADFMAIEFPDRFFMHKGEFAGAISDFRKKLGSHTKCDIIYIDVNQEEDVIEQELKLFRELAHPIENIVLLNTHPDLKQDRVLKMWSSEIKNKHIIDVFKCSLPPPDEEYMPRGQYGFMIGSYVGLKTTAP